jgi:SPP1 family predicted phage head-tail adaptor
MAATSMHAGRLDKRVTFKRPVLARDSSGGAAKSLNTIGEAWANIRTMSGREREQSERVEGVSDYVVTVRYRSDLQPKDVIIWGDRTMNIRFIRDAGARESFLEIEASAGEAY